MRYLTGLHVLFFLDRERILSLLENNRVVVLCGETGCGKTTQVPQFILDSYLERREGAKCNIVVTQVRNTNNTFRIFSILKYSYETSISFFKLTENIVSVSC